MEKLIIIGSGPAGLTAAIYAARANLSPLLIAGYESGGQLMLTTEVENYPGFPEGITGPELMMNIRKQAQRFGTKIIDKNVTSVDFSNPKIKKVFVGEDTYEANAVIIATGASARWLNIPGEDKFRGRGISTCATCDGAFYRNKVVAVVGGGDSAMEEANFLTRFASKVYIIHRRNEFRASKIMQERVNNNPKIEVILNTTVSEVLGGEVVEKAVLENIETHEKSELLIDGLFIAIGHDPNTKFLQGVVELDDKGYILTKKQKPANITNSDHFTGHEYERETNIAGVFVAGDVFDYTYRQAITAAGSGCQAALEAEKYLESI